MSIVGIFTLPYEPYASKNKMHGYTKTGRIFLHPKARAWRKQFAEQIKKWLKDNAIATPQRGQPVSISLVCHFPLRGGKRGHQADASNFVDLAADSVKDGLGIDDYSFSVEAKPGSVDPNGGHFICLIEL